MSSMLAAVARAMGYDEGGRNDSAHSTEKPKSPPPKSGAQVSTVPPATAAVQQPPRAPLVSAAAAAYLANLESLGHRIDAAERGFIMAYGEAWERGDDIRSEFMSFGDFAAYMRARKAGKVAAHSVGRLNQVS